MKVVKVYLQFNFKVFIVLVGYVIMCICTYAHKCVGVKDFILKEVRNGVS